MTALWRIALTAPDAAAAAVAASALDTALDSVSAFEREPDGLWLVEGLSAAPPDRAALEVRLALVLPDPPALAIERLPPRDWVSENQAGFPPIEVGRFFIHGPHHAAPPPANRVALLIAAATAFGTGEHATTQTCLMALDLLARRRRRGRVLDMGTGTGILAIAAAKTWRCSVTARDIDGEAVHVARRNAAVNGVRSLVAVRRGSGYADRALRRRAPYDLVFANILARPITLLARGLGRSLASGGVAVLSGLLARHEPAILAAHRLMRLRLVRRIDSAGWRTLILARGFPETP